MASLNISMPDELRDFVDRRAKQTHHATPTEYIRSLVREDQKRAEHQKLEALLIEGLQSGTPLTVQDIDAYVAAKKQALVAKLNQKNETGP